MNDMNRAETQELLARAKAMPERFVRSLYVLAILTRELEPEGIRPVLVGGGAVEFYTMGGYTTQDLDLVVSRREAARRALEGMGFTRLPGARHWYREDLDVAIEIPSEDLAGSQDQVVQLDVDGLSCYVIGVEDLVIDRLNAYVHWRSELDGEWAARLMALHAEDIDWPYLERQAREAGVAAALGSLRPSQGARDSLGGEKSEEGG